jgi:rhodanese-related sulfurtransferase
MSLIKSLLTIVLLTTAMGVSASELVDSTPLTVDGATTVDAAMAKDLFDREAVFVDLRKENVWNSGRVPGAIWIDYRNNFTREALAAEADSGDAVVFYCSGVRCPRSAEACTKALAWGYTDVYYFRDGFPAWKLAGYPVE